MSYGNAYQKTTYSDMASIPVQTVTRPQIQMVYTQQPPGDYNQQYQQHQISDYNQQYQQQQIQVPQQQFIMREAAQPQTQIVYTNTTQ